ncbi:MAG TPA: thiamine phosphate synthase [Burkholderiales bacterium]|nr:thiamine phosphate synthase [Burkholderiales bacterium]
MLPIKGLYAVTPDVANTALLLAKVETVLAAGARLLQYRNKSVDAVKRGEQARALRAVCRRHAATLIINDDVTLARAIDADGVHVGADDPALAIAREQLGSQKIIGVSCYDDLQRARAAATQGADYVAFGSFFASAIKPGAVRAPLSVLPAARALGVPVVAIGGITLDNVGTLIAAGADAVAVISALFAAPDPAGATRDFCRLFQVEAA